MPDQMNGLMVLEPEVVEVGQQSTQGLCLLMQTMDSVILRIMVEN